MNRILAVAALAGVIGAFACLMGGSPALAAEPAKAATPMFVAPAPTPRTADLKCGAQRFVDCTRARIASLKDLSDALKRAAKLPLDARPQNRADQDALESYDRWLRARSDEASALAAQGELAISRQRQEMIQSFNLQYLQVQKAMQQENRTFSAVSNILKTKHDTVKNSISNMR
jgi:hypothetical protein